MFQEKLDLPTHAMDSFSLRGSLERILLLYEEALDSLHRASVTLTSGDEDGKSESLSMALAVLMELRAGLDHTISPALTKNLEDLYTYVINRIFAANSLNDQEAVTQAIQVLDVLRKAWQDIRPEISES
ncbi:MAG: flagellar export chaperone FliS [Nitrospirae bacterium]|nr:flagellar export chaperone FliS [Nitrospirota bacterium]